MIEVDARGLSCPEPIMLTNEALINHPDEEISVLLDEACSITNVQKLAKSKGKTVSTKDIGNGEVRVELK